MSMLILIVGQRGCGKTHLNNALTLRFHREVASIPVYTVRTGHDMDARPLPSTFRQFTDPYRALDAIWKAGRPNFLLSVSEAQNVAGNRADLYDPRMRRLIFEGRHVGAHLIFDTQRASSVSTDLYSQATDIFSFRQEYPGDLSRLEEWTGHPEDIDIVKTLAPRCFFSFRDRAAYTLRS